MREGWELKKLGDVCDLLNGFAFKSKSYVEYSNVLNIRMSNIRPNGTFNPEHNICYLPNSYSEEYKQYILNENDLIIAMTNMAGDPKILGLPTLVTNLKGRVFLLNQRVGKLTDYSDNIFVPYLRYYLSTPTIKNYYKSKAAGGFQLNISKKDILTTEIPIPSLLKQKQIVTLLDQAFGQIVLAKTKLEQNIHNAKELFESKLNEVFSQRVEGWVEKRFDEVCVLQRGFDLPTRLRNKGTYPLVSSNGISDKIDIWKVKSPGVVTGRTGTIGKVHFIEKDFFPLNTALYIKNFNENYERCIYYFLKQFDLSKYQSGSGVPTLNRNNVHSIKVYFPNSYEVQVGIVDTLDILFLQTQTLQTHYKQKLNNIEELKKSILEKAFRGKL